MGLLFTTKVQVPQQNEEYLENVILQKVIKQ